MLLRYFIIDKVKPVIFMYWFVLVDMFPYRSWWCFSEEVNVTLKALVKNLTDTLQLNCDEVSEGCKGSRSLAWLRPDSAEPPDSEPPPRWPRSLLGCSPASCKTGSHIMDGLLIETFMLKHFSFCSLPPWSFQFWKCRVLGETSTRKYRIVNKSNHVSFVSYYIGFCREFLDNYKTIKQISISWNYKDFMRQT